MNGINMILGSLISVRKLKLHIFLVLNSVSLNLKLYSKLPIKLLP